jgi:hypothetical protein
MRKLTKKNIISLLEAFELSIDVKATRAQLEDKLVEFLESLGSKEESSSDYLIDGLNRILDESEDTLSN